MVSPSEILRQFDLKGVLHKVEEIHSGLINSTFLAEQREPCGSKHKYILQKINSLVFTEPTKVMQNIELITRELEKSEKSLKLFHTKEGKSYLKTYKSNYWRCYNYIENAVAYDECHSAEIAYHAAFAFSSFSRKLNSLNPQDLHTTIPNFHHTKKRFQRLQEVIKQDPKRRTKLVEKEISFILSREPICGELLELQSSGTIPTRITHNDTKVNNVMMSKTEQNAICVIDLDTTMPGLIAHDFGDLVRTSVSPHKEDSIELSTVRVRPEFFRAIAKGYKDGFPELTETELHTLPLGAQTITLEVAIRFLTDFLEGDVYFKTNRPNQNLDRCRTQLKLIEELEKYSEEFNQFMLKL